MSVTQILYEAAGHEINEADKRCWLCGGAAFEPTPLKQFVKPTFTDHDKVACPGSDVVCAACVFCHDEQSELLTKIAGKWWATDAEAIAANSDRVAKWQKDHGTDKLPTPKETKLTWDWGGWSIPQRMRNYSHFVMAGKWIPLSKGNKAQMTELLLQGPELAVIAVSGQKHVIFRAQPGWWQIEEQSVLPFPSRLRELLSVVESLYAGFSKAEIESGEYYQDRILKFGLMDWTYYEGEIAPLRGSATLQLAIFLAQKGESDATGTGTEMVRAVGAGVDARLSDGRGAGGRNSAAACSQGIQQLGLGL